MDDRAENRGGPRQGAGRPVSESTLKTQMARKYIAERLMEDLPEIYEALAKKAKRGDTFASNTLFDRGWGKAVQAVVTEDGEGNQMPLQVQIVNYDNNTPQV